MDPTLFFAHALAPALTLVQQNGVDLWSPVISFLKTLLLSGGTLGLLGGLALKALAGTDENKHAISHRIIGGALTGLLIGLLATELYDLFFYFTGGA